MKRIAFLAAALAASAVWSKGSFKVATDHADAVYSCGEKAVFTVTAVDDAGAPVTNGMVSAFLDNFG